MQAKGPLPLEDFRVASMNSLLRSYLQWSYLKRLFRQGWLRRAVEVGQCESVADHAFAVALLAMLVMDAHYPDLDREKVLRMALLHDLGEVYAGDLTPADRVARAEKHELEEASMRQVLAGLEDGDAYLALWNEYERGATPEARLVREVDRLEMGLQAAVYERRLDLDLNEFRVSAAEGLVSPVLIDLLDTLSAHLPSTRLGSAPRRDEDVPGTRAEERK